MDQNLDPEQPVPIIRTTEVKLTNIDRGLGFSIVGGSDNPHIPGHNGVFISRVRPNTAAAASKKLSAGDRIVQVNGIDISDKTHDEAVEVFKSCVDTCTLVVEPDAERILLTQPSNLIVRSPTRTAKTRSSKSSYKSNKSSRDNSPTLSAGKKIKPRKNSQSNGSLINEATQPLINSNGELPPLPDDPFPSSSSSTKPQRRSSKSGRGRTISTGSSHVSARIMGLPTSVVNGEDDEDCASTVSVAPSIAHSVIDDIPRTPKKPPAFMDPNNPSILTEVLFVTVGAIALGAGIVVAFKYYKNR